jgi:GTPase SAR1 family protein
MVEYQRRASVCHSSLDIKVVLVGNSTVGKTSIVTLASTEEYKGSYEITEAEDGSMTIKFTFEDSDASKYAGTKTFKENKDAGTITIGMTTYTKQ